MPARYEYEHPIKFEISPPIVLVKQVNLLTKRSQKKKSARYGDSGNYEYEHPFKLEIPAYRVEWFWSGSTRTLTYADVC